MVIKREDDNSNLLHLRGDGRSGSFNNQTPNVGTTVQGRFRAESLTTMTAFGRPNEERSGKGIGEIWGSGQV